MGGNASNLAPLKALETPIVLDKFLGAWYVIANIPTPFEIGAHNAVEEYKRHEGGKYDIDVKFSFRKGSFGGPAKVMHQKGWVFNALTNTEWRVSPLIAGFAIPYKLPYIIVDVTEGDSQYETTIVGYPDRSYLWVMARKPTMSDEEYNANIEKVKNMGYDPSKVLKVPQQAEDEREVCVS